ncbi:ATPase 2 plasma membrane-type, partial [Zea mays]
MKHAYRVIVADPPYLSKECLEKVAKTVSFLARPEGSFLLLLTVPNCTVVPYQSLFVFLSRKKIYSQNDIILGIEVTEVDIEAFEAKYRGLKCRTSVMMNFLGSAKLSCLLWLSAYNFDLFGDIFNDIQLKHLCIVFQRGADQDTIILMATKASRTENQDDIDAIIVGMMADPKE